MALLFGNVGDDDQQPGGRRAALRFPPQRGQAAEGVFPPDDPLLEDVEAHLPPGFEQVDQEVFDADERLHHDGGRGRRKHLRCPRAHPRLIPVASHAGKSLGSFRQREAYAHLQTH